MKKVLTVFLCLMMLGSMIIGTAAASPEPAVVSSTETTLENGLTMVDELIVHTQTRSTDKTADRRKSFYDGDTLIAVITFTATFRYDGSTVSVVSKSVTQTDTYEGWSFKQTSFTSSGGTVTLEGKLTKWLIFNSSFTMGMTCDVNGNISFT